MSVDHNIYLGYYFHVRTANIVNTIEYDGCPKCKKEISTPFCPTCGTAQRVDLERVETYKGSVEDMCEELGEEWEDYLTDTDPMCGKTDIAIFNRGRGGKSLNLNHHFALRFDDEKPELSPRDKLFVERFKERFGDDSMKMEYGLVSWFS